MYDRLIQDLVFYIFVSGTSWCSTLCQARSWLDLCVLISYHREDTGLALAKMLKQSSYSISGHQCQYWSNHESRSITGKKGFHNKEGIKVYSKKLETGWDCPVSSKQDAALFY